MSIFLHCFSWETFQVFKCQYSSIVFPGKQFTKYQIVNIPPLYTLGNCTKYQIVNIPPLYTLGNCTKYQIVNIPPLYTLGNCTKYQNVKIALLYSLGNCTWCSKYQIVNIHPLFVCLFLVNNFQSSQGGSSWVMNQYYA